MQEHRPTCIEPGCKKPAAQSDRCKRTGKQWWKKRCHKHSDARSQYPKRFIYNSKCVICGWDKAFCDRHRMKPGKEGGGYTKGNLVSLCPNCHRLAHVKPVPV